MAAPSLALRGLSPHWHLTESRTRRVCAGAGMRAGGLSPCSCLGSGAIFPPKTEVCPLFKQQHSSGLINYLFAVLVSLLGKHW